MYNPYIAITLGLICVFLVPIFYYNYLQKKKTEKVINNFKKLGRNRDLHLDFAESMPNLLIGLDATSKKLFTSEDLQGVDGQIVSLEDLVSCDIHTVRKPNSGEINLIALHLNSAAKAAKAAHNIIFYNAGLEVYPDAERRLEAAEKWKKIISANLIAKV